MRNLFLLLVVATLSILTGCSMNENIETEDSFDEIRKIAWDFVKEQGWGTTSDGEWQSAEVQEIIMKDHFEILDLSYNGRTVLKVTFIDRADALVSTPVILIAPDTGQVVGYLLGE
ncbi:hypothetical protein [Ureibacillus acetophenoni]|uniref:DUF3887 domain-containing protein n=1 Tax=Ureibacillus acetophenoni TaxID=614649 RepID=A0A285U9X5_9BACL|nr:hypothetical protein [Ureibacillus acetophenoni]SOC38609.1 hypothetical protein SAMN05877842_104192 [Ureibacillus acetophenoni]